MLSQTLLNPMALAWMGAIFLFFGEVAALLSLPSLTRVLFWSTIAEIGYVLIGFGLGGDAGATGAFMHILYQLIMRGLVIASGWYLVRRTGSSRIDDLAGSGSRMPVAATLFGFGMFSVMGLSPFKGSFSKFLILYAAIEQNHWAIAAIGTLASMVAAYYYITVIQRVCLEMPARRVELAPAPKWAMPISYGLAAVTIAISVWALPFEHFSKMLAGAAGSTQVPEFESPWAWLVLLPYVGGFVIYAIGHVNTRARDIAAVVLALATLAAVAADPGLDPTSRVFMLLFAGIVAVMVVYSIGYMARAEWTNRYYFFTFLMLGSLIGLTTAEEFGNFYVFWELMTWTSYFLVVHDQTPKSLKAGLVYFMMCASGAYIMHYGILLAHASLGSFDFHVVASKIAMLSPTMGFAIAACFLIGFAVKIGLMPFQSWVPMAYPAAPSSASGPLSGILSKCGVFGIVKVLYVIFGIGTLSSFRFAGVDVAMVMLVLGCLTLAYGEIRALFQTELKRMLAYSSLGQLGEVVAILSLGTVLATDAAILHVTNHAVMKTALFYAAGAFILRTGLKRIEDFRGLGRVMPVSAGVYAIASAAIMGLPPFSGFVSKFLMIYAAAAAGYWPVAALMLLGGIVGVVYYTRVLAALFYFPYKGSADVREAPATMLVAMVVLGAAILGAGLMPGFQLDVVAKVGAEVAQRSGLAVAQLPTLVADWPLGATVPMVGAVLVLIVGRSSIVAAGRLAVAVLVATVAVIGFEASRYDLMSLAFAFGIAGVGALNMLHATSYLADNHAQPRFYATFTVMMAGLIGLCSAKDIFSFFAFWELMSSWALWAAIVHEETDAARREGFKYFLFNTVGAAFMFLGVGLVASHAGTFELAAMGAALDGLPVMVVGPAMALIFLGLVMKAAQLPVRIDYQMHPALAPTPVSGYISSVLLKAGPWGVLKLFVVFGGTAFFTKFGGGAINGQPVLMYVISCIAGITILYAGAMAVISNGIKLVLIYSTVCQLAYVMLGVSLGTALGTAGGLFHFFNHMMLKDTLFLVAGAIMVKSHATMLDELGGLGKKMPITFGIFLFNGLSLAGVPPLNGFASKWVIFQAAFESGHWALGAAAMGGSLLTLAAILKFAHAAFMGAPTPKALAAKEAPMAMLVPMGLLTAGSVIVGIIPGLFLVPISWMQAELGFTPFAATWLGALPGMGGWSPSLMSVLVLLLALMFVPWMRLMYRGAGVQRGGIHQCGVNDILPETTRIGTAGLYETPTAIIRGVLVPDLGHGRQN
jgi:formate hydrogenlyase subunit 3/multisubunit Na+/H+ antiporter MnhD subunit